MPRSQALSYPRPRSGPYAPSPARSILTILTTICWRWGLTAVTRWVLTSRWRLASQSREELAQSYLHHHACTIMLTPFIPAHSLPLLPSIMLQGPRLCFCLLSASWHCSCTPTHLTLATVLTARTPRPPIRCRAGRAYAVATCALDPPLSMSHATTAMIADGDHCPSRASCMRRKTSAPLQVIRTRLRPCNRHGYGGARGEG